MPFSLLRKRGGFRAPRSDGAEQSLTVGLVKFWEFPGWFDATGISLPALWRGSPQGSPRVASCRSGISIYPSGRCDALVRGRQGGYSRRAQPTPAWGCALLSFWPCRRGRERHFIHHGLSFPSLWIKQTSGLASHAL